MLTALEVAYRLRVSPSWVYRRIQAGAFVGQVQTPAGWRVPVEAVEQIEAERQVEADLDAVYQAFARDWLADYRKRTGRERPDPAVLTRIAEMMQTADHAAA
jgi:hypothetical protein